MRTKKGGIAEKMGIKYRSNLDASSFASVSGPGPNACWDEVARHWPEMSSGEPLKFKPISKDDLPKIDLITGEEVEDGQKAKFKKKEAGEV
ncbi:MAG: hypothetical protein Q8O41_12255 [Candidatus Methanoperedens sp.]|nr:hypothetical protein [Candidatus Methanoperedens sp.]